MLKTETPALVTGGAGFIGSQVTRALTTAGCHVRVLDDLSNGKRERLDGLGSRLELLHADIRNTSAVEKAAKGANGKKQWTLQVTVPPDRADGRMPADSNVVLTTNETPPRRIRIPVRGHASN